MTPQTDRDGYLRVALRLGEKRSVHGVHSLVARAFIGPRPEGFDVDHIDTDRSNNVETNLRYRTHADNVALTVAAGRQSRGEDHARAALTEAQVLEIRRDYRRNMKGSGLKALAQRYGVTKSAINHVVMGATWKHVEQCQEHQPEQGLAARDARDFAIEHAGYLADSADDLLDFLCRVPVRPPNNRRDDWGDLVSGLRSAVYEFRKRRYRAAKPAEAGGSIPGRLDTPNPPPLPLAGREEIARVIWLTHSPANADAALALLTPGQSA